MLSSCRNDSPQEFSGAGSGRPGGGLEYTRNRGGVLADNRSSYSSGLSGYRRAEPFFLGLILGEFVVGAAWTLVGIGLHKPTYDFWP